MTENFSLSFWFNVVYARAEKDPMRKIAARTPRTMFHLDLPKMISLTLSVFELPGAATHIPPLDTGIHRNTFTLLFLSMGGPASQRAWFPEMAIFPVPGRRSILSFPSV